MYDHDLDRGNDKQGTVCEYGDNLWPEGILITQRTVNHPAGR